MLMEPEKDLHHHRFPRVDDEVGGQDNVWLDPPDHPVHLALPLESYQVLLPLSYTLNYNPCEDVRRKSISRIECNRKYSLIVIGLENHKYTKSPL